MTLRRTWKRWTWLVVLVALLWPANAGAEELPAADVGRVFASWQEWRVAYDELVEAIEDFEGLTGEPIHSPARLLAVLQARDRVFQTARGVEDYLYLRLQLNAGDEEARSRQHLLDETDSKWYSKGSPWFAQALTDLGPEQVERWQRDFPQLGHYEHFRRRFFRSAEKPVPEGQEALLRLSRAFARQSSRTYQALATAEAPVIDVTLESGQRVEVDSARSRSLPRELLDADERRAVHRAWLQELGKRSQTYAALLEGIVSRQKLLAEVRGFDSALDAHLHSDAIPADLVRGVVRTAREGSGPMRHYHALRRELLDLDDYSLADRFVSLETSGHEIPFAEARRLIVEAAAILGPEIQGVVARAFAEGWIDAVERPGKRPHGGANFVAGHPFVLVPYRGTLDHVFQLVHEIGHAVHSDLSYRHQPFVYSHASSLTSETVASVFEGALVEYMTRESEDRQQRSRVFDLAIQNVLRLFYRPMLDADFELRFYESDAVITGPALGELYLSVVADFYGDAVSVREWDAFAWQQTPHYYTAPLYMGRYGLSTAAAQALIVRLTSESATQARSARNSLLELMKAGSSDDPIALLKKAGADLGDPRTAGAVVDRLDLLVGELERSANLARP